MSKSFEYYRKKLEERKSIIADLEKAANEESRESSDDDDGEESMISSDDSNDDEANPTTSKCSAQVDQLEVEKKLIEILNDPTTDLPVFSYDLHAKLNEHFDADVCHKHIVKTLNKFHLTYKLINLEKVKTTNNQIYYQINEVFGDRVNAYLAKILGQTDDKDKDEKTEEKDDFESGPSQNKRQKLVLKTRKTQIEEMLRAPLATETEAIKLNRELLDIVSEPTAKEKLQLEHFKSSKNHVQEYCHNGTKEDCFRWHFSRGLAHVKCDKIHFKRIIKPHTDISLGDCSFLNTCYNMNNCKYIHYEVDLSDVDKELLNSETAIANLNKHKKLPPQWIQCDLRTIDMRVLGKFSVIMADPPWDIHMELPYGTMADEEMRKLDIPSLQDEGYIFLWVTGRAMELGRECLKEWNYERCDEIIWVKTNQLQRIIRTGRTGHWLNHGKEHCLVGVKGKPRPDLFNIGIDCDVIVAEVRATSHKPDEIYHIIERLSPGTRKVELFGRPHNVRPNWITLGNQLDGVRLIEPDVVKRFKARYPDGNALQSSTVPSSNSKTTNTSNNN